MVRIYQSGKINSRPGNQSSGIYDEMERFSTPFTKSKQNLWELKGIPKYLQEGTISVEDRNFIVIRIFYYRLFRAALNLVLLRGLSGGSTLTQQLLKMFFDAGKDSYQKNKELMLSIQVDRKYSKDQILEMYLNDVPYGGTAIGVERRPNYILIRMSKIWIWRKVAFLSGLPKVQARTRL